MMKRTLGPTFVFLALASALAANAQTTAPSAPPSPVLSASPSPVLSASPAAASTVPATPLPSPTPTSPSHAHLHRPGTDVDGDAFTGSLESQVYVIKGNVTVHSDPKVDKSFSSTESDEPLTLTADELDVDRSEESYVAKGHVHFTQGTRAGQADTMILNEKTHDLDLLGHATVSDGDRRGVADKMHYNSLDKQFRGAGDVRMYNPAPTPNPNASGTPGPKKKRRIPIPI